VFDLKTVPSPRPCRVELRWSQAPSRLGLRPTHEHRRIKPLLIAAIRA
jgi:hypothetical protein